MIDPPVGTVHVHLEEALPALPEPAGTGGTHAVFWLAGVPLGEYYLHPTEHPLSTAQLATLAANATADAVHHRLTHDRDGGRGDRPLERLRRQLTGSPATVPDIADRAAVVIVTADRPDSLGRCLAALRRLDPQPAELLVVDNSPSGSARAVTDRFEDPRYVHAPDGGLAAARNTALSATDVPIVAFTDDDIEVHPGWLAPLLAPFASPDVASVTGLVLPATLDTPAQLIFERHLRYLHKGFVPRRYGPGFLNATSPHAAPVWRIGAGASMALRRSAVEEVGGFDPRLGAGAAGCAEDSELWHRLLEAGYECVYDPAAVVFHHHRANVRGVAAQTRAYLRGHVAGLAVQYERSGRREDLRRTVLGLPRRLAVEAPGDLAGGPIRRRLLLARIRGYLEGLIFLGRTLVRGVRGSARQRPAHQLLERPQRRRR